MLQAVAIWSRRNLFAKPFDALLSVLVIPVVLWCAYVLLAWAFSTAQWETIPASLRVLMVGVFPADQLWRAWIAFLVFVTLFGGALGCVFRLTPRTAGFAAVVMAAAAALMLIRDPVSGAYLLLGSALSLLGWSLTTIWPASRRYLAAMWTVGLLGILTVLAPPGAGAWGGLMLSVLITVITAILTLPIGILLAFGRRSRFISVRAFCTTYIEVMRSVPLILVVYCIWIVLPLLAPEFPVPDVVRGMIGFTIFFSAYVAEYIRSGLQAVARGQEEAALSLGLSSFDVNREVVLPQAIRVVVPALVGNVLDIFNAAPLVFIIGLTDFLRAGQMILANPQSSDRIYEIYLFLFIAYFLIGSLITFAARKLELHLARGTR